MKVLVRGRIHYTKWTDQQGVERYGCEIIAETVDFLSRKQAQQPDSANRQTGSQGGYDDNLDDDIPF